MNPSPTIEIVNGGAPALVEELAALQQSAFPPQMQFQDPGDYYTAALAEATHVNVVLRAPDGQVTGYLLAIPQDQVCSELRRWDPAMIEAPDTLYIDIIQTLPGRRQMTGLSALLGGLCKEARQRGFGRISAHVRTTTGLSRVVRKLVKDCHCRRQVTNWYDSGECFDFLDAATQMEERGT